ncbi:helix-turn-helix domain-containing protein [Mangrovicoccus ximenensis]|uniref:helix-turn-helix domain-containing protein n=1 Tax=Mangrovicoccus ximenensis TaxID=1911570 RepID=UPI001374A635|nr:helix-turn-helix transcriptional regulator [Mangrovicoccus ximenensis]
MDRDPLGKNIELNLKHLMAERGTSAFELAYAAGLSRTAIDDIRKRLAITPAAARLAPVPTMSGNLPLSANIV